MLVIISDLHLSDSTCSRSIPASAFHVFADRMHELAYHSSWRTDGKYRPLENIDLVLLGDVLDTLHSTLWLDTPLGSPDCVRPWSDSTSPRYAAKVQEITQAIMQKNADALEGLRNLSGGELVKLPPADSQGHPAFDSQERITPNIRITHTVGNHDWYYHLPGPRFDAIRHEIIAALGLSNPDDNFPWNIEEYAPLHDTLARYGVYAHHGDKYDVFNCDPEKGRDSSTLGDVFAVEMLNRYPVEVARQLGTELPAGIIASLRRLVNVRPALATSLWISSQIQHHSGSQALEKELKRIWDDLAEEFLQVDFVRHADKAFQFDLVDALEVVIKISKHASFHTINELLSWVSEKMWGGEISYTKHALQEPAFLNDAARYIVYGHTHHPETVVLDEDGTPPNIQGQIYFNSGTWHAYDALAVKDPDQEKFVPFDAMTYLAFYKDDERNGRRYETWTGSFA